MITGLHIERLHRALIASGQRIDRTELDHQEFGASTLAALRTFQTQRGLAAAESIDAVTLAMLLQVEQGVAAESRDTASRDAAAMVALRGTVTGSLVDGDGRPIAGMVVALVALQLRSETSLGGATTDMAGQYTISYARPSPLNLVVRASDATGKIIATSATVFAAPTQVEINLTTAEGGVVRAPSQYTLLQAATSDALQGTPLAQLQENKDVHDVNFLASSIGVPFTRAA